MTVVKAIPPGPSDLQPGTTARPAWPAPAVCTTLTGAGRSAIAVIGIGGPYADGIVSRCLTMATAGRLATGQVRFAAWTGPRGDGGPAESVVITALGEERFEVHCHGGPAATARILEDMQACGAAQVPPGEWASPMTSLLIREATQVLSRCTTARTAAIAMDQVRGALLDWVRRRLSVMQAGGSAAIGETRRQADGILASARITTRLAEPFRIVLCGPPNVGKSSLLNALVGFNRSITLDTPGTTRDVVHADTVIAGLPVRLSDTAGIRDSEEAVEREGIRRARRAAAEADLVLRVSEPARREVDRDADPAPSSAAMIGVMNKSDLLSAGEPLDRDQIATSALTGDGIERLWARIAEQLAGALPAPAQPAALNDRQARLLAAISQAEDADTLTARLRELADSPVHADSPDNAEPPQP
jgi:tRNA modification GTPase